MKTGKKMLSLLLVLIMLVSLTACGSSGQKTEQPSASQSSSTETTSAPAETKSEEKPAEEGDGFKETPTYTLKFAQTAPPDGMNGMVCTMFADLVYEATKGDVKIEVYHSGVLGSEADMIEGLRMGTLDMTLDTPAYLSALYPQISLFDQPYLFTSWDDAHAVIDGDIGKILYDGLLESTGIRVLGSVYSNFRIMNTTFPIRSIEDLAGKKVRAPEAETYIKMFQALGANPTPIPFGETYTAIQSGVVDGVEVSADIMVDYNFHEVTQYCAITNHIYSTILFCIADKTWQKIPAEYQEIMMDCLETARAWERDAVQTAYNDALKVMEDAGLEITYPDLSKFQDACAKNQDEFAQQYDCVDLLQMVREQQGR